MKKTLLALAAAGASLCASAQTDSVQKSAPDTIRVGGMVIVRDRRADGKTNSRMLNIGEGYKSRNGNVTTNGPSIDLGFSNFVDNTNYGSPAVQAYTFGSKDDLLRLRTGKSVNVNIWFFRQQINLVKHVLNFKYALGVELNNYRFDDEQVRFTKNPTTVFRDLSLVNVNKNKLAADYLTVPAMLNVNFTPGRKRPFGFSGGVSAGYLYSSRQKIRVGGKKTKTHDDFDLEPWKLSWIGELQLGHVRFYGTYAMKSMFRGPLDVTPYTVGIRFGR